MLYFIAKRFAQMLLVMVGCSILIFVVTAGSGLRVEKSILGPYASEAQYRVLREKMQLDDPLPVRYLRWLGVLGGLIDDPLANPDLNLGYKDHRGSRYFGNLGFSKFHRVPVNDVLWNRLGNTALLAGVTLAILYPLSLLIGVLAGMREGSRLDRSLSLTAITAASIPEFATAVFLLAIFVLGLQMLPGISTLLPDSGWSLAAQLTLPVAVLLIYDFGYLARIIRSSMVGVMTQPYIRTAVLKGLTFREVVTRHALRNAMITPLTVMLLQIPYLLTGVVVTETVFAYPGLGRLLLQAAVFGDIAVVQAATLVAVAIVVATQFLGDIGYMLLNPTIRVS